MWFMQNGMANPNNVGAGAHHYMHILGIVALGSMWLMMAEAATKALAEGRGNKAFLEAKLVTARSEEHTSELQSLMRISSAVFCLKKKNKITKRGQTIVTDTAYETKDNVQ